MSTMSENPSAHAELAARLGQRSSGERVDLRLVPSPVSGTRARAPALLERLPTIDGRLLSALVKRTLDVVVAALALLLAAPLLVVIAIAIKTSSPGPVLFGHQRLGRNGTSFTCLKFRTMVTDADRVLAELFESRPELREHYQEHFKLPADPRVTPIGRWLRRTSMDELPQFLNVLRGDMSVVGPRPIVTAELEKYGDWRDTLLSVRPGVTGLWQVSGRSDLDYATRVDLDVSYVRRRTLRGDLAIMLRTVRVVFMVSSNGAY